MLYPNYFNQTSFSTNWLEAGEHIKDASAQAKDKGKGSKEKPPAKNAKVSRTWWVVLFDSVSVPRGGFPCS